MRIHELDESLNKLQGIAEAGSFSYGAKKPRKGSLAHEIQQKRKQQDTKHKPIEPKDRRVGTAKVSNSNVNEENVITVDVWAIHEEMMREELLKNPALFENRDDFQNMRKFLDLHITERPTVGNSYIYASVFTLPGSNKITVAHFNKTHRIVNINDSFVYFNINGKQVRFPETGSLKGDALSQIYFFNSKQEFDHFNTLLGMKFSDAYIDYKTLDPQTMAKKTTESVKLNFRTVDLKPNQIESYTKKFFERYNIEESHGKFVNNIKRLANKKIMESAEANEIAPFVNMINSVDTLKTIKVGDQFAVLSFELVFAYNEINVRGFTTPKEVVDVKMHSNGSINYIKFSDGDRYPRLTPARYSGKPITYAAYFNTQSAAESALTALTLKVPADWDIDVSAINQNTNLDEATYSAGGGVRLDFNVKDTVRHILLGDVQVIGFDGGSAIVKNNKGQAFKVSPASLTLVKKASATTQPAPVQTAAAPTTTAGAPIGQSITYNTTSGPVKFTKSSKGWEALFGTARKIFTVGDAFYSTLEKVWQSQRNA